MTRFTLAFLVAMTLAGCASQNRYVVDESSSPSIELAAAPVPVNPSVPQVRTVGLSNAGPVSGPRACNSDNRPTATRTGIGSDPDNPNGVPQ